jgi:hypothetical protein
MRTFCSFAAALIMANNERHILSFLCRTKEIETQEVVKYLIKRFEESVNKKRMLHLMCEFTIKAEEALDVAEAHGLRRYKHKAMVPEGGWITVYIRQAQHLYAVRIDADTRCDELKERFARKVG